jgi:hypothetical protein
MKKSYHSIIEPAHEAMSTVLMERGDAVAGTGGAILVEVMQEVAAPAIRPQLWPDERCVRNHSSKSDADC